MKRIFLIFIIFCFLAAGVYTVNAYVASSTNYRIQSDSINVGGARQTSNNYISEDTIGELATGISESSLYKLKAGYQEMQEIYIAISAVNDVTLLPSIGGISGGSSNGLAIATTTTDGPAGYSLGIKASTSPALKFGSYSFSDYTPQTEGIPDYNWGIDNDTSEFGYTVEGADTAQKFKNDESNNCNAGSNNNIDQCWYNLLSVSSTNIAGATSANHPNGTATTVKFQAQSLNHVQVAGTYTAKLSITAIAL